LVDARRLEACDWTARSADLLKDGKLEFIFLLGFYSLGEWTCFVLWWLFILGNLRAYLTWRCQQVPC